MDAIDGLGVIQSDRVNPDTPIMTDSTQPYSEEGLLPHKKAIFLRLLDESKTWDELKRCDPVEFLIFLNG
jgi:hypothetical protein